LVAEVADFPDDENARFTADAEIHPMGMVSCESDIAVIDTPHAIQLFEGPGLDLQTPRRDRVGWKRQDIDGDTSSNQDPSLDRM
jgi:hypothetical protein